MSVDPEPPPQPAVPQPPIGGADRQLPAPSQAPAAPAAADVADETQTAGGTDASQRKVEEPNDEEAGTARDVVVSENGLAEPTFVSFRCVPQLTVHSMAPSSNTYCASLTCCRSLCAALWHK